MCRAFNALACGLAGTWASPPQRTYHLSGIPDAAQAVIRRAFGLVTCLRGNAIELRLSPKGALYLRGGVVQGVMELFSEEGTVNLSIRFFDGPINKHLDLLCM